ncbi:hypothetical protein [Plantactinospora sp. KLBMP9567]|uniref:hypothetical protein n=1 Tax=unclassified Plantactinospora TaxID=2631981 RepID=UPI002981A7F6|nr:hypothetical protein [Plantactinospora sp. KLBMP9567]MDW5329413.1 hypothetical protein [Plantactinospora sp. KLBMP9567]
MSLEELTHKEPFYAAMRLLTETAWRRNMTVEALLTLTELLDPADDANTAQPMRETRTRGTRETPD